jgi:integrase
MARNLLTAVEIKNSDKPKLRDGDGLWLHTSKAGGRYWVFIYTRFGRRREMGLGAFGAGTGHVTLAAARVKADEVRTILGRGGDPFKDMVERQRQVKPATFGQIADEYIDTMKSKWRGRSTEAAWRRMASTYAKALRKIPIAEVDTDAIVRVLRPIWSIKPETASKVRERIGLVLDHARARKLRSGDNPATWKGHLDQILPPRDALTRANHAAMPFADVPAFMAALRSTSGVAARALEFIVLTAARSGEARGAVWSEIDFDAALWTVPAKRMKSGREHRVPLSARALEILRGQLEIAHNDLVFPGLTTRRPLADRTVSEVLRPLGAGAFTVHGFRSCLRDWCGDATQFPREIAEAALAHTIGGVEAAYRRSDALDKRRALMDAWDKFCCG